MPSTPRRFRSGDRIVSSSPARGNSDLGVDVASTMKTARARWPFLATGAAFAAGIAAAAIGVSRPSVGWYVAGLAVTAIAAVLLAAVYRRRATSPSRSWSSSRPAWAPAQ